jgi:hypothetical protein
MDTSASEEVGLSAFSLAKWPLARRCENVHPNTQCGLSKGTARMTKTAPSPELDIADSEAICSTTTIAALLLLGAQFPHRQFNSAELCVLSGIGRTAMSQIKNASDTPFSLGKCTLQRLDKWLAEHPGQKQE